MSKDAEHAADGNTLMMIWQWFNKDPNINELNSLIDMSGWYRHDLGECDAEGNEWWDGPESNMHRLLWWEAQEYGYQNVMRYWIA